MRKSALEKLVEAKRKRPKPESMTLDELMLMLLDGGRSKATREANPTQRQFIYDSTRIKGYMGPAGCAKTSTICAGGWLRALMQPGSKGLVARANYNDLTDTTALRMQEMLNRLPKGVLLDRDKSPPMKWWIDVVPTMSPEGDIICEDPAQITFMGLQDGLGSYEFDWAALDEAAEMTEQRVHEVNTRLRNRPGSWPADFEGYSLGLVFNPPDKSHWLYRACTGRDHQDRMKSEPWIKLFVPQPRENVRNLPSNYYENLAMSLPEDMRIRLIEGLWGSSFEGQPVFPQFKMAIHSIEGVYEKYDRYSTLYRFWDFGFRRPVCIWAQMDMEGRLLVMREKMGENQDIHEFAPLCRKLTEQWFPGVNDIMDYGDPAVRQQKDTGSTLVALTQHQITMRYKTSSIEEGLRAIRLWLERMINGEPAFQFDKRNVPILIDAMRGGYHYPSATGGPGELKPKKDGFFDHPADAFRYGIVNVFGGGVDRNQIEALPQSIEYDGE
jgi:hypothetical protein